MPVNLINLISYYKYLEVEEIAWQSRHFVRHTKSVH